MTVPQWSTPITMVALIVAVSCAAPAPGDGVADTVYVNGTIYTVAVLVMGVRAIVKYRHSRYQIIRTCSVMFFQLGFAFLLPQLLLLFNKPEFYFSYFWPLKYDYLWPGNISYIIESGASLGVFMVFWGIVMISIVTPTLTYFFGKRWYCSHCAWRTSLQPRETWAAKTTRRRTNESKLAALRGHAEEG